MAYARYDRDSDWYVFWHARKGQEGNTRSEQELAIWHCDHRPGPIFTFEEVQKMLATMDFSQIPGRQQTDDQDLACWLNEFIRDVESEYPESSEESE